MVDCRAHAVYRRLLSPKGNGYPLWIPEPDESMPDVYRQKGVSVGDLGLLTEDGGFDFLFNIHADANSLLNCGNVPADFEPLPLSDLGPTPIRMRARMHQDPILSDEVTQRSLAINATAEAPLLAGGGFGVEFSTVRAQGAILVLPDGATRYDARNRSAYQQYAERHAKAWYFYVNNTLGRCAANGTLYLVTGCDKAKVWGLAAFKKPESKREVSLKFTIGGYAEGSIALSSSWQASFGVETRRYPLPGAPVTDHETQCVFARGICIGVRDNFLVRKLLGPAQLMSINGTPGEVYPSFGGNVPLGSSSSPSSGSSSASQPPSGSQQHQLSSDRFDPTDSDMLVSEINAENDVLNPSSQIVQHILAMREDVDIALVHDEEWIDLLKTETDLFNTLQVVLSNKEPVVVNGIGILKEKAPLAPDKPFPKTTFLEDRSLHDSARLRDIDHECHFEQPTSPPYDDLRGGDSAVADYGNNEGLQMNYSFAQEEEIPFTNSTPLSSSRDLQNTFGVALVFDQDLQAMAVCKDMEDLRRALSLLPLSHPFSEPLLTGYSPNDKLVHAQSCFQIASKYLLGDERVSVCTKALKSVMSILPSLLWVGTGVQDQHIAESLSTGLAFALECGEYLMAVEWLELGRSMLWQQMLRFGIPVDDLKEIDANLGNKLDTLAKGLSVSVQPRFWDLLSDANGNQHKVSLGAEVRNHWRPIAEVRQLLRLEKFLMPKDFDYLSRAADDCVVVIINLSDRRCDAVVIFPRSDDSVENIVRCVPLNTVDSIRNVGAMYTELMNATKTKEGDSKGSFMEILATIWYEIILPVLVLCHETRPRLFTGTPGAARPRIHWCPTEQLTVLPLHAAGDYSTSEPGHKVYDFVVSSYIPTLSSLIRPDVISAMKPKIVAVSCAKPKGHPALIGTQRELGRVEMQAASSNCEFKALTEHAATNTQVLEEMKTASWVHFACHAVQDAQKPMDCALILADETRMTLSDVAKLDIPHAELAFLSACHTATGYSAIPYESVHVAAGMLIAGYRSVIGTMWSIQDQHAPDVANDVYGYLLRGGKNGKPNYKESAIALDLAVQNLREKVGEKAFLSWVPYIHIGA